LATTNHKRQHFEPLKNLNCSHISDVMAPRNNTNERYIERTSNLSLCLCAYILCIHMLC